MWYFFFHAFPVLLYILAALLVVHLAWNAITNRRVAAWLQLIGVLLLVIGLTAPTIRPMYKFKASNVKNGSEVMEPDDPYWTILQSGNMVGAMLVIGGLGMSIVQRISAASRARSSKCSELQD